MERIMRVLIVPVSVLLLSACAIQPNGLDDPMGMGAALARCFDTPREQRTLPDWFAMFGPALACR
jgi:hypothetical protein